MADPGPYLPTSDMSYEDSNSQDTTVYFPYEIEEPDDEPTFFISRPGLRRLPDYMDYWQRELIKCIEDLNSDPEYAERILLENPRGQKRKSADTCHLQTSSDAQSQRFTSMMRSDEQPHNPGAGPRRKRLRIKSKENATTVHSLHDFREARSNWSSSSGSEIDDDTMDESAATDDMDID
ncbi:hypothetical protein N7495_009770 [Penicillium taxi]|uniref:uncharacterized protein n=1 Tax=Penicillium taxi TaxID=168475 RepID=UPI002544EE10|nr:uncharacterized protein N7495_009770 [Penicillium taxi]KAJ5885260.1 hypothetical protein N7495_009770 [Penicillium taxi]